MIIIVYSLFVLLPSIKLSCIHNRWETLIPTELKLWKCWKILTALPNFTKLSCKPKHVSIRNMCAKISFLAFTDSKCPQWTEKNMTKSENFRDFWVKRQVFSTKISKKKKKNSFVALADYEKLLGRREIWISKALFTFFL